MRDKNLEIITLLFNANKSGRLREREILCRGTLADRRASPQLFEFPSSER